MKYFENEFGGRTLCLRRGDDLAKVPSDMRSFILPHIIDAFSDPRIVFERMATRTPLGNLAAYLQKLIAHNDWQLDVEEAFVGKRIVRVGFHWDHPDCYPATFVLRPSPCGNVAFAQMFDLIAATYWDRVGCAGEILPATEFHPLADYGLQQSTFSEETQPIIFGTGSSGDVFVYCSDGRAGVISHKTGDVMEYDSVHQCCDWIFEQLLAGSPPEFDWQEIRPDDDEPEGPFQLRLLRPDD